MVTKIIKFLGLRTVEVIVIVLLIVFMPNIPPNAKFQQSYSVTPHLPLEGKLALNERLKDAEILFKGELHGPEAFASYNGELYTTILGGDVVKLTGNHVTPIVKFGKPCKGLYQEHICGRPLGLNFDKSGALYVADAYYGVFKVDVKTGKYVQLVSMDKEIANKKPKVPNSVAIASNGDIYWTDSSTEFALSDLVFDFLADGSGRLIHYDAKTKKNTVLIDNLHFANGVALSKDESFVIVSESAGNRIHRYYLKGPKKGTSDIFIEGLPGVPDNIHTDGQGGFILPLVLPVDSSNPQIFQSLGPFPLIRKFLARVLGLTQLTFKFVDQVYPNEWAERAVHFIGHFGMSAYFLPTPKRLTVLHISESGQIIDSLHSLDGKLSAISDAFIHKDALYLGSPHNDYLARVPLTKAGLKHLAGVKSETPKVVPAQAATPQSATKTTTATSPPPKTATPPKTTQSQTTTPPPTTTTKAPTTKTSTEGTTASPPTTKTKPVETPTAKPPAASNPPTPKSPTPSKTDAPTVSPTKDKPSPTTPRPSTQTSKPSNKDKKPEPKQPETKDNKESKEKK